MRFSYRLPGDRSHCYFDASRSGTSRPSDGFWSGYLDACTEPYRADPNTSGPHKRVTSVKFGGLRLLLRHKALAAIYPKSQEKGKPENANKRTVPAADGGGDRPWPSSMNCSAVRFARGGYLGDHNDLKQVEFASISKMKSRLVVDKWLDMLFIGSDNLYLGEHVRGKFNEPSMRNRADALELSGLHPSDGRRILFILEMLLDKIIRFGRKPASGARGRKESGDGDGKLRQPLHATEPFSFTIVSSDECRKLVLYKTEPNQSNKRSDTTPPACVSDAMMAALLADDGAESVA